MEHSCRARRAIVLTAVLSAALASAPSHAADPLGFYFGAGAGYSKVRAELPTAFQSLSLPESTTGWKIIAGVRPLPFVGAELEYVDFGRVSRGTSIAPTLTSGGFSGHATDHPSVANLFALGYVPLPLPSLAVFAKAGAARFHDSLQANGVATCALDLPCFPPFIPPYSATDTSTHFAWGAGLQAKLASLALRAEYERVSTGSGKPDQLALAVVWSLL